jgi:hypothetical protein
VPGIGGCVEPSVGPDANPAVVRADDRSFVLRPDGRVYRRLLRRFVEGAAGLAVFGAGTAFLLLNPQLLPGLLRLVVIVLTGGLAFVSLLWLLLWRYAILFGALTVRFDTGPNLMTYGPSWARRSRPLAEIVAVQIVSESVRRRAPGAPVKAYQVNLVLDDPNTPRLGLVVSADRVSMERTAQGLADFLGVPLANQVGKEGTEKSLPSAPAPGA